MIIFFKVKSVFSTPMHILLLVPWYKSAGKPVVGSFFEAQYRALLSAGNKVSIFVVNFVPFSASGHSSVRG
jgi:hypothetical protein